MSENQYVMFSLGSEKYCSEISNVSSITEVETITKVPNSPEFIEGIINLRGEVIPIVNLKKKFKILSDKESLEKKIIIIKYKDSDIGFLVDDASQVVRIQDEDIEPTPAIIAGEDRKYISGVGKINGGIVVLLNLVLILNDSEIKALDEMNV